MIQENIIGSYVEKFCQNFANELEQESLVFYSFPRTFEDKSDAVRTSNGRTIKDSDKFQDLAPVFDGKNQRLLLLGEPGTGKTILLRKFSKNKGEERRKNPQSLLPIFGSIRTWNCEANEPIIDWLFRQVELIDSNMDRETLESQIRSQQVLLILDGLDELTANVAESQAPDSKRRDYRIDFIKRLSDFESEYGENPIIVTCRSRDYEEIIGKDENHKLKLNGAVILKELGYSEINGYLHHTLNKNIVTKLWSLLAKNLALLKMARTPFLLTVLVSLYKDSVGDSDEKAKQFTVGKTRNQLFDNFVNNGYEREKKKKEDSEIAVSWSLDDLKQILGQAAILMMSDWRPDDNYIFSDIFESILPNREKIEQFTKFAQNIYLLVPTDNQTETTYRFRHLLLRDYFAFRYAYNSLQNNRDSNDKDNNSPIFEGSKPPTKAELAIALGKLKELRAADLLIDLLTDQNSDKDVRYEAASSLGHLEAGIYFRGYKQNFSDSNLFSKSLSGFDKNLIKEYFQQSKESNRSIDDSQVEKIAKFSLGIPFVVKEIENRWGTYSLEKILAPVSPEIKKRYKTPSEQVIAETVKRFLVHSESNKQDKRAIYILAMMRRPANQFLKVMLDVEDVKGRLEELYQRYSFVLPDKQALNYNYAKFLKDDLLRAEKRKQSEIKEINRDAIKYCREHLENLIETNKLISANKRLKNQEFTATFSDLVHYKFWWSEQEYEVLDYLIPYLVEGWHYNNNWVSSLLEIAAQFVSPENELLQAFNQGLTPLASDEEKSHLLDEFEEAFKRRENQEKWENNEWKVIVLLKQADLLFNQKKYPEVIRKCHSAEEYFPQDDQDYRSWLSGLRNASLTLLEKLMTTSVTDNVTETKPSPPLDKPLILFVGIVLFLWFFIILVEEIVNFLESLTLMTFLKFFLFVVIIGLIGLIPLIVKLIIVKLNQRV